MGYIAGIGGANMDIHGRSDIVPLVCVVAEPPCACGAFTPAAFALPCVDTETESPYRCELIAHFNLCCRRNEVEELCLAECLLRTTLKLDEPVRVECVRYLLSWLVLG